MKKVTRLTESDLKRITNKILQEGMFGVEDLRLEEEVINMKRTFNTILQILGEMEHFSKKGISVDQFNELKYNLKRKFNSFGEDVQSIQGKIKKYEGYLMDTRN